MEASNSRGGRERRHAAEDASLQSQETLEEPVAQSPVVHDEFSEPGRELEDVTTFERGEWVVAKLNTFVETSENQRRVLPLGSKALVEEQQGKRVRIAEPFDGWIILKTASGDEVLEKLELEIEEVEKCDETEIAQENIDESSSQGTRQRKDSESPQTFTKKVRKKTKKIIENVEAAAENIANKVEDVAEEIVSKVAEQTGIHFAPVKIPLKRRRQTCGVLIFVTILLQAMALNLLCFFLLPKLLWYVYIGFVTYSFFGFNIQNQGGYPIQAVRELFIWTWFTEFFPLSINKTVELSTEERYIFGYHPHGIISIGAFGTFGTRQPGGFHETYPGIDTLLLTLNVNFKVPFLNIFLTFMGLANASKKSILAKLRKGPGHAVVLVLGGAKESLDAHPGKATLYLQNRKGFVKIALREGCSLVPVYGFGENELFKQMDNPAGSELRQWQDWLQKKMGFAIPVFWGRGVFQYDYGMLPQRKPIDVYFGQPIKCPKIEGDISNEILDEYHQKYLQSLTDLYNTYRDHHQKNSENLKFR